jgi:asparagine synthase (glutamine-hydrolysing)
MALLPGFAGSALRGVARLFSGSDGYMNRSFLLRQLSYGFGKRQELQSIYWMAALPPMSQKSLWRDHDASEARFASILQGQVARAGDLSLLGGCQRHFIQAYLAHDILTKMDRASMYASLEVRSPFLSNAVSDMALSLPFDLLLRGGQGKYILRRAARDYLPEETISRKKHGFALPVSALLRSDLRDVAGSILLDSANAMYGLIDHDVVRTLWKQHVDSGRDNGKSLWALVMLAAFFRNLSSQ